LLEHGLAVDGALLTLDQIGPLATVIGDAGSGSSRVAGDGAIDAWVDVEHDQLAYDGGETNVIVRVRGGSASATRGRLHVHLVLDRSSSMQSSWHEVLEAARLLVDTLAPTDVVHVVAYGTRSEEILAPRAVGDRTEVMRALRRIRVGGGTNIEAGLDLAYGATARTRLDGNDRALVILVSDGVPTEGEMGAAELAGMAARARVRSGCTTTVVGVGSQFDEEVLRTVSREGRGGYHVARVARLLAPTLRAEIRANERIAARDVRVEVALPAGVELVSVFDAGAGVDRSASGGFSLALPALAPAEERRIVARVRVDGARRPAKIADVSLGWRAGGAVRSASGEAWVSFGDSARASTEGAGIAILDASLGAALDAAGRAVRYGDRDGAVRVLRAHVAEAEARVEHRRSVEVRHRTAAVGRLAVALEATMPRSGYEERRSVGLALGALSVSFGR
jgi:Ca-activated chloride channel family protein